MKGARLRMSSDTGRDQIVWVTLENESWHCWQVLVQVLAGPESKVQCPSPKSHERVQLWPFSSTPVCFGLFIENCLGWHCWRLGSLVMS